MTKQHPNENNERNRDLNSIIKESHSFPQPSGPTMIKGCLLLVWSQDWKESWFRCWSGVLITGRAPELARSDKVRLSGSCTRGKAIKHTRAHMWCACVNSLAHNYVYAPQVGRWPVCQIHGHSKCPTIFWSLEGSHESCGTPGMEE